MRGRSCTQPFLVEGGTCRPDAFLLLPCWVSRSPPHPPQCAHWGTFPPRGRLWAWVRPFPTTTPTSPSPPSRWAGRYRRRKNGPQARQKKERTPCRVLKTRVGSPEGRNSPLWPSFPPFLGRNGGPCRVGALRGAAPRGFGRAPPTRRVRSTAPPRKEGYPEGYPHFYSTVSWMEPVAFSACTMI